MSLVQWPAVAFTASAIYVLYKALERMYWHPYSKYPGPFIAKLTDWYAAYYAYKGDLHIKMKEAHDRYGDTVRFGPSRLLINTESGLNTIYKSRHTKMSRVYRTTVATDGAWLVFNAIDKNMHARKNRIMRQAVTVENLRRFEPLWIRQAEVLIERLTAGCDDWIWTVPKDISYYTNCMTMDVMGTVGFGRELKLQSSPKNRYMINVIATLQKWNSVHIQSNSLAKLNLDKICYPQQLYYGRKLLEQVRVFVDERTQDIKEAKNDIFSFIVDAKDPETGEQMPISELWSEAKLLMVATYDQIATLVSTLLFYLVHNPSCYARLVAEIRGIFQDSAEIHAGPAMDSCRFLEACIKESLRMSPPTGGAPWREIESEALIIDGEVIPKGCDVGTCIYSIHHNEEYFPDSYVFRPERWLGGDPAQDPETAESAWCPFLLGTRVCLGKTMAMMETKDIVSLLLWRLDLRLTQDERLARVGQGVPGWKNGRHRPGEFWGRISSSGPRFHYD